MRANQKVSAEFVATQAALGQTASEIAESAGVQSCCSESRLSISRRCPTEPAADCVTKPAALYAH